MYESSEPILTIQKPFHFHFQNIYVKSDKCKLYMCVPKCSEGFESDKCIWRYCSASYSMSIRLTKTLSIIFIPIYVFKLLFDMFNTSCQTYQTYKILSDVKGKNKINSDASIMYSSMITQRTSSSTYKRQLHLTKKLTSLQVRETRNRRKFTRTMYLHYIYLQQNL